MFIQNDNGCSMRILISHAYPIPSRGCYIIPAMVNTLLLAQSRVANLYAISVPLNLWNGAVYRSGFSFSVCSSSSSSIETSQDCWRH
jgi:hypothetical protein